MNPSTTALTLNMALPNIATVSWAVQGDQLSRVITATLVDGTTPWPPQEGYHGVIRFHKPDGTSGVYDVDEDGNDAVTWDGNVATLAITQQALTCAGSVLMQLEFYDTNDARITAFGWVNNVQPSAVTDTEFLSTDYYNILTLQIAGVLGASSHPPYINSTTKDWMIWDENEGGYVDSGYSSVGAPGPAPEISTYSYEYANSASGTTTPSSWSETKPEPVPGQWSWTKTTINYDNEDTVILYNAAYQGNNGQGAPGSAIPLGGASSGVVGTATAYSREDHQHPFQTAADTLMTSGNTVEADVSSLISYEPLYVSGTINNTTKTITNAAITADMIVIESYIGTPLNVSTNLNYTTSAGQITFTGTLTGSTTISLVLAKTN